MDRSDYSHLYHDSHFSSVSGMLEAREHLRAREVNAREQRLLHQQDRLLQQAKVSCHRRHSWELDNVRRDLHAILERTPTFDRSLKDERWRMSTGHPLTIHGYAAESDVSQSCAGKQKQKAAAATIFNSVPSSYKSFPKRSRTQLSPISTTKRDILNRNMYKTTISPSETKSNHMISENPAVNSFGMTPTNHQDHHARTRQAANHPRNTDPQKPYQVTPTSSNHRYPRLGEDGRSKTFYPGESTQVNCPLPGSTLPGANLPSQGQRKGALLRRRSHHAIMAIVRSKTRHELRSSIQTSVATKQTFSTGSMLVNPSSQSLTDLPSVCSPNSHAIKDAPWPSERQSPLSPSVMSNSSSSKGSWLSVPISMPDVTEAGQEPRDRTDARARPRFYSVE